MSKEQTSKRIQEEEIKTGYYPRPLQEKLHSKLRRFNVLVCHRRFGKTIFALNELLDRLLRCPRRNPQGAYIGPTYGSVQRVAWDILKEYALKIPNSISNEQKLWITIERPEYEDRVRIMLLSAENPGSLRGIYLDSCVLDEYAEQDPTIWSQVVRPALSDRLGSAIFIGTPKGNNHFYDIYMAARGAHAQEHPDWFTAMYKASETKLISKSELDAARFTMTEEEFAQEFECDFAAALVGAYYGKHMQAAVDEGRVTRVPHDPGLSVITGWDLGMDDATAIWFFQLAGREWRAIDYKEFSGAGFDEIARALHETPYRYEHHYLPHDAAVRELGTGVARTQTLSKLGIKPITVVPKHNPADGIHACRMILPKVWFDSEKCDKGIRAMQNYERKWDAKEKVFKDKPRHNWASHGADAFRTFGMGMREDRGEVNRKNLPRLSESSYDIFGV